MKYPVLGIWKIHKRQGTEAPFIYHKMDHGDLHDGGSRCLSRPPTREIETDYSDDEEDHEMPRIQIKKKRMTYHNKVLSDLYGPSQVDSYASSQRCSEVDVNDSANSLHLPTAATVIFSPSPPSIESKK